jgi:aryl-alcohol dehydrogenase-like predicted oxidoreductase
MTAKKVNLPGTDLYISSLCLGGGPLGSKLSEAESFRLMDQYVEHGGNMIDTAEVYANWRPDLPASISEITIGKWIRSRKHRQNMIVTTKGAHPRLDTMRLSRLSPEDIIEDVEGSLRRLQVDTIDLYWLHRDDENRPVSEILGTLQRLISAGKIRYIGCSNWKLERIQEARNVAKQEGLSGFIANQPMWSLAQADTAKLNDTTLVQMDEKMERNHEQYNWSVIPYSSQAQGLFSKWASGTYTFDDQRLPAMYRTKENRLRFERALQLAEALSLTVNQIVLGYLLSKPFPVIPIIGAYSEAYLNDCFQSTDVHLSQEQLDFLFNQ